MTEEIKRQTIHELKQKRRPVKGWTRHKRNLLLAILVLNFLGWSHWVQAQDYPTRAITLLISMAPGAGTDVLARIIAQSATKILGQEIIPVNRPGGGGAVAAGILANSKGDGYTLLSLTSSTLTSTPHLEQVPYDPLKDIVPIIQFGYITSACFVRSDSPHKSLKDLIDFARKNPGNVSYGIPGIGTIPHLAIEYVVQEEKVNIAIIPFSGSTPAMTALLGGHVSGCGSSTSGFVQQLKAGKVRVLATTADKRIEVVPSVPTLVELGYPYGAFIETYLIAAPKGTPPDIVKRLEGVFGKAMETREFRNLAEDLYCYAENPLSGPDLKEFISERYVKNGEVIRKAKLGK